MSAPDTLVLGYGNLDRQDDGIAWHILTRLAQETGLKLPPVPENAFTELSGHSPELLFALQLTPELAETIAQFQRVCFVDAHTGNIPQDIQKIRLDRAYQPSPFTHHMTPATCLAICSSLYNANPQAILVSVRGYEFGFSHQLSAIAARHVDKAVQKILVWLSGA